MAANKEPIYPKEPDVEGIVTTVADSSTDGTTVVNALFPRAANHPTVNGCRVDKIIACATGLVADAELRLFMNNGNAWSNSANNRYIHRLLLSAAGAGQEFPVDISIPPGHRLGCVVDSGGSVNWSITAHGGIY